MIRRVTQASQQATASIGGTDETATVRAGLLEKLVAAVRPEFRCDVLTVDPRDPVFGGSPCRVELCEGATRTRGLCLSHYHRWRDAGQPDIDGFVLTTTAKMRGYAPLEGCSIPRCLYGRRGAGLCTGHHKIWQESGRPELTSWLLTVSEAEPVEHPPACVVSWCTLWAEGVTPLCLSHGSRWRTAGRPNLDDFVRRCDDPTPGFERIDFSRLRRHLRLELQYVVQQRRDHGQIRTPPRHVQHVINVTADSGVDSLLDWSESTWRTHSRFGAPGASQARALVVWASQQVENLHYGCGWEVEYPRDVWRLRHLGVTASHAHVRFDRIPQQWLRELAKRWLRLRLANGHSAGLVVTCAAAVTRLGRFLAQPRIGVERLDQLTRHVLELYLADLATSGIASRRQAQHVSATSVFLRAIRLHRWADDLPADAMFFTEDYPKRPQQLPRALAEHVMAQIELP
ncbi:MAG: hypothetical protein QOE61_2063, partial [Micromonosporaceae bacterium]|nr:hypothetical protein [Micromonosporaceae bacterium]